MEFGYEDSPMCDMDGDYESSRQFILNTFDMSANEDCGYDSDENDNPNNSGEGDEHSSGSDIGTPQSSCLPYLWVIISLNHYGVGLHIEPL